MKLISNRKKLNQSGFDHVMVLVGFVVLFALIGTFLLLKSRAASWNGTLQLGSDRKLCMNDNNSSKKNGTTIGIYTCGNYASEKWTISKYSNGQFQLKNSTGICADDWAYGVSTASKTVYLKTYTCQNNNGSEFWKWNGHELENVYTHGCINDPAYSKLNGKGLIIYPCGGSTSNEQWFEAGTGSSGGGSNSSATECAKEGGNIAGSGCYFWGQGTQGGLNATGAQVTMSAIAPKVGSQDLHSNNEILVGNSNESDMIEFCSIVGPGSSTPKLLLNYWKGGNAYNNTDFVYAAGAPLKGGSNMPTTGTFTAAIEHTGSQWQVYYNGKELGYYPDSIWGNAFKQVQYVDIYGEVEGTATKKSTSQMGNGLLGTNPNSSYFSNYKLIGSSIAPHLTVAGPSGAAASVYKVGYATATGFHYGGPGF